MQQEGWDVLRPFPEIAGLVAAASKMFTLEVAESLPVYQCTHAFEVAMAPPLGCAGNALTAVSSAPKHRRRKWWRLMQLHQPYPGLDCGEGAI